jgi:hypothetical protein
MRSTIDAPSAPWRRRRRVARVEALKVLGDEVGQAIGVAGGEHILTTVVVDRAHRGALSGARARERLPPAGPNHARAPAQRDVIRDGVERVVSQC